MYNLSCSSLLVACDLFCNFASSVPDVLAVLHAIFAVARRGSGCECGLQD